MSLVFSSEKRECIFFALVALARIFVYVSANGVMDVLRIVMVLKFSLLWRDLSDPFFFLSYVGSIFYSFILFLMCVRVSFDETYTNAGGQWNAGAGRCWLWFKIL